jgi:hypothetical protein
LADQKASFIPKNENEIEKEIITWIGTPMQEINNYIMALAQNTVKCWKN